MVLPSEALDTGLLFSGGAAEFLKELTEEKDICGKFQFPTHCLALGETIEVVWPTLVGQPI